VEGQPELLKSLQIGLNTGDFFLRLPLLVGLNLTDQLTKPPIPAETETPG